MRCESNEHDRDAVLGLERVEQLIGERQDLHLPAEAHRFAREVGLEEEDQEASLRRRDVERRLRRLFVERRELARAGALRNPLHRLDRRRHAVDPDAEVFRLEVGNRIAAVPGDADVDQDALDGDRFLAAA